MEKRWFLTIVCLFISLAGAAESMSFVTTLSQPVGIFKNLDTVGSSATSTINRVKFCMKGKDLSTCNINSTSSTNVLQIDTVNLNGNNSTLTTQNVANFYVKSFLLQGDDLSPNASEELRAKDLVLNGVTPTGNIKILLTQDVAFTYNAAMTTKIAAFDNMVISGVAQFYKDPNLVDKKMQWGQPLNNQCPTGSTCSVTDSILYSK